MEAKVEPEYYDEKYDPDEDFAANQEEIKFLQNYVLSTDRFETTATTYDDDTVDVPFLCLLRVSKSFGKKKGKIVC